MSKNLIIFVNNYYPKFAPAMIKLAARIGNPIEAVMLIDAERKASGKYRPDEEGLLREIVVDFSDDAALRKAIKPLEDRLLLISCDSEQNQLYFKRVIPHVPYIDTPTESSIDYCTDKGKMRELFISYDPSITPKAATVKDASLESVEKICAELSFPLIVKPTNLAASMLVNKVTDKAELLQVLKRSFDLLDEIYSQHRGLGNKEMVIDEYIEGDLFSVDAYVDPLGKVYALPFIHSQNGAMVGMDSYQIYQTETYHTLSPEEEKEGALVAEKAVHALGLRSSVAHIELFRTKDGWKVIELGARAGGWRQEMYEISYGIDHAYNELLIKTGFAPEMPSGPRRMHSAVFRIHAPKVGILESVTGIEEARKRPGVRSIEAHAQQGDKVLTSTYGGEELVDGLVVDTDHNSLNRTIEEIRAAITVNVSEIV